MRWRPLALLLLVPAAAAAQLRVATWNISNYGGGRVADIQAVVHGAFEGRTMGPDALVCEEIQSAAAQTAFLNAINAAPGSPGTWAAAPFTDGSDTDNAFFYRSDRLVLVGSTIVSTGGNSPLPPRDAKRYDVRLLGYGVLAPKIAIYGCHMKAGTAPEDEARRLAEAMAIRADAQALTGFDGFVVVGDLNVYSSTDDAFVKLTGSEANNAGRVFDPIATPGNWDGQAAFRFVHTQDPATSSGMNSRFDFVLLCQALRDGAGFDYVGNPDAAYSTVTWNDAAHSYRAWGNDGTSFNNPLTVVGNAMVGATIAQAMRNAATQNGGHIPVFLDLRVPAELAASPAAIDFGTVVQGSAASRSLQVANAVDTLLWRTGVADLFYSLAASSGFGAPAGSFSDPAGGGGNVHAITMDTATPGVKSGVLAVSSPVAGTNAATVPLTGQVVPDELMPSAFAALLGTQNGGTLASLFASDDERLSFFDSAWTSRARGMPAIEVVLEAVSPVPSVGSLAVKVESQTNGFDQQIAFWDRLAAVWVVVDLRPIPETDTQVLASAPDPSRALDPATGMCKVRLRYQATSASTQRVARAKIDQAVLILR